MEKSITWYRLSLKQNMKKPFSWVLLVIMLFLLWMVSRVHLPDGSNLTVAVCYNESLYTEEISKALHSSDDEFAFLAYEDQQSIYEAVKNGTAECGFVFSKDFDESIKQGDWDEVITCYTTPFGVKTDVAKETLYAAIFPIYGRWLLMETEDDIYWSTDEARIEQLLRQNESYLEGAKILTFEEVRVEEKGKYNRKGEFYPLHGLVELFVLLAMLLAVETYGQKETAQIESALLIKEKLLFRYMHILANGTSIALAGLVIILFSSYTRGIGIETVWMLSLVLLGAFGVLAFSKLCKNHLTYLAWVTTFVLCFLLLRFGVAGYIAH